LLAPVLARAMFAAAFRSIEPAEQAERNADLVSTF
jgi:hypothetical protein